MRKWCSVRLGNLLKVLHQVNCVANVLLSLKIMIFSLNLAASQVVQSVVEKNSYIGKELGRICVDL